jgi:MarR family transcriptional regulator for hemolysin
MDPPSAGLAAAGLVERVPSATDRRVNLVVVTERGRVLAERVRRESEALRQQLLQRIGGERIAAAASVLEELQQMLEEAR